MKTLKLFAGIPQVIGETGRNFRIFSAQAEVEVGFFGSYQGGEWSFNTPLLAGIGIEFSTRPSPFTQLTIISEVDQTIEYWASLDKADDDRLSGASTVTVNNTASSSNTPVKQTLTNTVSGHEVLPLSINRKSALLQLSGDCYVESVADGVLVNGSIEWENRGALILIPVVSGVEVRILEELG